MSNLRILGLIVGILSLYLTFRIYRGPRWRRLNFLLFGIFGLSLIAVSINPNLLNTVAEILKLEREQRGRILVLLIGSNIFLWLLLLHFKTRLDEYKYQFDLLIRNLGHEEVKHTMKEKIGDRQIMVVIPAYNEAENLEEILKKMPDQIKGRELDVLVVDDGSDDDTAQVIEEMGYLCVRNRIHRGQGAALRLGYDVLLRHNVKIGVTMDADGQHMPEEIEVLIQPILEGKYNLVIGSRILGKREKSSLLRSIGISFLTKVINALTGLKLTDCSSGFKAFDVDKMRRLNLREDQFQSAEVLIEAAKKGLRVTEVPITVTHRRHGKSKKGVDWRYGVDFVKVIIKAWWR